MGELWGDHSSERDNAAEGGACTFKNLDVVKNRHPPLWYVPGAEERRSSGWVQAPQEADPWPVGSSPSDDIEKEGGRQRGPEVTLASEPQKSQSSRITAEGLSLSPGQPGSAAAALVGSTMRRPRARCAHLTPPASPSPPS